MTLCQSGSAGRRRGERAIRHKALVFTPHATQKDIGFFAKGVCTNRAEVIKKNLIAGFDVYGNAGLGVLKSPQSDFSTLPVPWFISGDVRKFEDVGLRATFLKLGAVPTVEGLRQAFLMPEYLSNSPRRSVARGSTWPVFAFSTTLADVAADYSGRNYRRLSRRSSL